MSLEARHKFSAREKPSIKERERIQGVSSVNNARKPAQVTSEHHRDDESLALNIF